MPTPPGFTPSVKGQAARDQNLRSIGRSGQKKEKRPGSGCLSCRLQRLICTANQGKRIRDKEAKAEKKLSQIQTTYLPTVIRSEETGKKERMIPHGP